MFERRRNNTVESAVSNAEGRSMLHPTIRGAHNELSSMIQSERMDPRDFNDRDVEKDLQVVERIKKKFSHNPEIDDAKKVAEVLEAILYQHIELSDWLGGNASTVLTSEYDDLVNGVDMIVEFTTSESSNHLALAIDATFSNAKLAEKLQKVRDSIKIDTLAMVKYYQSENQGVKGNLLYLPHVVVGVEHKTIIDLSQKVLLKDKRSLEKHAAQLVILEEIWIQLEWGLRYAKECNAVTAIRSYTRALNTLRPVYESRKSQMTSAVHKNDSILRNMQQILGGTGFLPSMPTKEVHST